MLSEENQQAISQDLMDAMTRSGIHRRFHQMTFSQVKGGEEFRLKMTDGEFFQALREGKGYSLMAKGAAGYNLFMVLARGMLICGVNLKVSTPDYLLEAMERNNHEDFNPAVLFLNGFCASEDNPFTPWQRRKIESFLNERLDRKLPLFTLGSAPLTKWWSNDFSSRLAEINQMLEVK